MMRKSVLFFWIFLGCLALNLSLPYSVGQVLKSQAKPGGEKIQTELLIKDCYDGDTCTAKNREGLTLKLRLLGIDAPEVAKNRGPKKNRHGGQVFGNESRDFLNSKVKGKWVKAEIRGSDSYQRFLTILFENNSESLPNEPLNKLLVSEGFAFAYRGSAKTDADIAAWAEEAEKSAKKLKKGLWGLESPPNDPSEFRKKNRN